MKLFQKQFYFTCNHGINEKKVGRQGASVKRTTTKTAILRKHEFLNEILHVYW